jgi:hypothetical protein
MTDDPQARALVHVRQGPAGRRIHMTLPRDLLERVIAGESVQLSYGDPTVTFEDDLSDPDRNRVGLRVGVVEVIIVAAGERLTA